MLKTNEFRKKMADVFIKSLEEKQFEWKKNGLRWKLLITLLVAENTEEQINFSCIYKVRKDYLKEKFRIPDGRHLNRSKMQDGK